MKIAVLSGKGGTGKTFVSVNLASVLEQGTYIDCDVEEPNGKLFLKPKQIEYEDAEVLIPSFEQNKCIGCRKCMDFCKFNALVYIKDIPRLFPNMCHSCGGCKLVCPVGAITEVARKTGMIEKGYHGDTRVITGIMNLSEESGVSVIKKALEVGLREKKGMDVIIDCPPGSACTVMESVREADFCILVAEPTMFGLQNLKMVVELVRIMDKPCGIVINKELDGFNELSQFCKQEKIPILMHIPYNMELAHYGAQAEIAVEKNVKYREIFCNLLLRIRREMNR